jgi:eukaryotic-like serine/threonine-protein kinase
MAVQVTLTVKGGSLDGKEYVFQGPALSMVGRGFDCDIRLPGGEEFMTVSRRHCLLAVDPPQVRVWDCGSHNGTRINGMQIGKPASFPVPADIAGQPCAGYDLHDDDELKVGGIVFQVHVTRRPEDLPERLVDLTRNKQVCVCE